MTELIKNACKGLYRRKVRTVITLIGIAIGVMSVVLITSIGDIGKLMIDQEMDSMGMGGIAVGVDSTATSQGLSEEQLSFIENDPDVAVCMPLVADYTNASAHNTSTKCLTLGVDENADEIASLELLYGRMITDRDVSQKNRVCVVDESFAQMMYHRSNIVGKTIQIQMGRSFYDFTVVGVVASGGNMMQEMVGEYVPTILYLPISVIQQFSNSKDYDQILLELKDGADNQLVSTRVSSEVNQSLGVENAASVQDFVTQKAALNRIFDLVTLILGVIAGISLVVAGLSIMTVMLMSVQERTKEIGIKKAIGATNFRIMLEFLIESVFLSIAGSILGIGAGMLISGTGCALLSLPYLPNWKTLLFCVEFSVAAGVLFGVYPAMKAASLRPAEALSCNH